MESPQREQANIDTAIDIAGPGNSEALSTTSPVLLNRKGLFGMSASGRKSDAGVDSEDTAAEEHDTNGNNGKASGDDDNLNGDVAAEEANDGNGVVVDLEEAAGDSEEPNVTESDEHNSDAANEEVFEKKVVSMDTSFEDAPENAPQEEAGSSAEADLEKVTQESPERVDGEDVEMADHEHDEESNHEVETIEDVTQEDNDELSETAGTSGNDSPGANEQEVGVAESASEVVEVEEAKQQPTTEAEEPMEEESDHEEEDEKLPDEEPASKLLSPKETPVAEKEAEDTEDTNEDDAEEKEEKVEATPKRERSSRQAKITPKTPTKTPKSAKKTVEEKVEEEEEEEEQTTTPRGRRGRQAKVSTVATPQDAPVEDDVADEDEKVSPTKEKTRQAKKTPVKTPAKAAKEENVEEDEKLDAPEPTPKRGRGRQSKQLEKTPKVAKEDQEVGQEGDDVEDDAEEDEKPEPTPKRGRGRQSKQLEKTPKVAKEDQEVGQEGDDVEDDAEKKTPARGRGRRSNQTKGTPVSSSKASKKEEEKEVEGDQSSRRSLRARTSVTDAPKPTPKSAAEPKTPTAKKTPGTGGRGRPSKASLEKAVEKEKEEAEEEKEPTEPEQKSERGKRGRASKSVPVTPAAGKKSKADEDAAKSKSTTKKKKTGDEYDPYDMDTEMEKHPDPFKNIHMEVQSFGAVKYNKVGSGKYEQTEKAAEARIGNLSEIFSKSPNRRSLADMTPGRKVTSNTPVFTSTKKSRGKKDKDEAEDEPMETEDPAEPAQKKALGRKRKSEAEPTPAKRPSLDLNLPTLSAEQQWMTDHPADEHAPHVPGARVFAIFNKIYYPAIITDERDALARFKVYFKADGIIKDVPTAGVIPLRAVVSDKMCFVDEKPARVLACPNAASAVDWEKGQFKVALLDEDLEPTGNTESVNWTQISLDMTDWRDYISKKSNEATSIATDNIASLDNRLRRSTVATPSQPKPKATPKSDAKTSTATPKTPNRRGRPSKVESPPKLVAQSNLPPVKKGAEALFRGKVFILTSANRPSADGVIFQKKHMKDYIERHEGLVFDDFGEIDSRPELEAFLISDTHYRTHKYLAAMARAMPCVSHSWITECADTGDLTDYKNHLLPSGVSIIDDKTYPLPTKRGVLLQGKRVKVHSTHKPANDRRNLTFLEIWTPIVGLLGGEVISEDSEERYDFLLTDNSAQDDVIEEAQLMDAKIVSSEYIIQGIIMSGLPPYEAHARFRPEGIRVDKTGDEEN